MVKLEDPWSKFLWNGQYIKFEDQGTWYYSQVAAKDFAHWEYTWEEAVAPGATSGPTRIAALEPTKQGHLWQIIFGIKGQILLYVELPTDVHRHGIPKEPKPSSTNWYTSHFTTEMSPYLQPSFLTEHFMMRPRTPWIALEVYNPPQNGIYITPVLNFFINKTVIEVIGTERNEILEPNPTPSERAKMRRGETLDPKTMRNYDLLNNLYRRTEPCEPITIEPIRAPAEAPAGE